MEEDYSCFIIENNELVTIMAEELQSTPVKNKESSGNTPGLSPINKDDQFNTSTLAIGDNTTTVEAIYYARSTGSELSVNSYGDDEMPTDNYNEDNVTYFSVLSDCYKSLEISANN